MLHSIFYTFSTIAQALAGTVALLGAFVLFRLQAMGPEIEANAEAVAQALEVARSVDPTSEEFSKNSSSWLKRVGKYDELIRLSATMPIPTGVYNPIHERASLRILIDKKKQLILDFRLVLFLTLGLILFAVFVLAFANIVVSSTAMIVIVLAVGLSWLVLCLLKYARLMLRSLD